MADGTLQFLPGSFGRSVGNPALLIVLLNIWSNLTFQSWWSVQFWQVKLRWSQTNINLIRHYRVESWWSGLYSIVSNDAGRSGWFLQHFISAYWPFRVSTIMYAVLWWVLLYLPSITVLGKHEQWSARNACLSEVYFIYYFRACRDLFPATRAIKDMVKTDQVATVFVQGLQVNGFPLSLSLPCLRLKLTCGNTSWCPIKERETRRCHLSFFPPYSSLYIYIYSFVVSVLEDLKTWSTDL